jgi:DNA-binding MarR family transcriptional regulator
MTTSDQVDPRTTEDLIRRLAELGRLGAEGGGEWLALQQTLSTRRLSSRDADEGRAVAEPAVPLRRQMLEALGAAPDSSPSELARQLDRSTSVVSRVLATLAAAGLVTFDRDVDDGRRRRYRLAPSSEGGEASAVVSDDPTQAEERDEYLALVISAAVEARRRRNDLKYAIERLSAALSEAQSAESFNLALVARRELAITLRQARETDAYKRQMEVLARYKGGDETLPQELMLPAVGTLAYELGRDSTLRARERLEHLTASGAAFRLCVGSPHGEEWASREGWALLASAELWRETTEFGVALKLAQRAVDSFRAFGDGYGEAEASRLTGFCHRLRGEYPAAIESLLIAGDLARLEGSDRCLADTLLQLGEAHRCEGYLDAAAEYLAEAERMAVSLNRRTTRGFALSALAAVEFERGSIDDAWKMASEAAEALEQSKSGRALNDRRRAVVAREMAAESKDMAEASLGFFNAALAQYQDMKSPAGAAACYVGLGRYSIAARDSDPAAAFAGLVSLGKSKLGKLLLPLDPWVPALLGDLAEEFHDSSIGQLAEWTTTRDAGFARVDEMAGEPRVESVLLTA